MARMGAGCEIRGMLAEGGKARVVVQVLDDNVVPPVATVYHGCFRSQSVLVGKEPTEIVITEPPRFAQMVWDGVVAAAPEQAPGSSNGDWESAAEGAVLLVAPVREDRRLPMSDEQRSLFGIAKLNVPRSDVPAITHVDYSARVQTVDPDRHGFYHKVLTAFHELSGCPLVVNTSFNVRGEPIVCSPVDAYHCFMGTDMDVLVLENCLLLKEEQPEGVAPDRDAYLAQFELD